MQVIGLDVGGAHVKLADVAGKAVSRPFPIWREPDRLVEVLRDSLLDFGEVELLALTTTAELADCFRTKSEGVAHVVHATATVARERHAAVAVWQTGGEFVTPDVAREFPLLVAAANWHAQATWLGRLVPEGRALLIDIGSTTTDLVPLRDGLPDSRGLTDVERLTSGELVYSGAGRTPAFHVRQEVAFRGARCPLVPELFATMLDVSLVLGEVEEAPDDCETANGRPATRVHARERLARAICCDTTEVTEQEIDAIAREVADAHVERLGRAIDRTVAESGPFDHVLTSGSGSWLVERALERTALRDVRPRIRLAELFDEATATAACARAVAELAVERRADLLW